MGQYRSKNKPYANVELNVTGRGDKKKGSGSASLKVKKGKTKVKVNLGGGFQKTRPVEGVDVENYGLTKGLDLSIPLLGGNLDLGASESREKFQVNHPYGVYKEKGKPVRNFRAGLYMPVGVGTLGITGDVTPKGPNRKRKLNVKAGYGIKFNKGGKVKKK
tara:strand:- start:68 stop:550 length:483 start_codon:yes stop_codon:yes gene_type:complete